MSTLSYHFPEFAIGALVNYSALEYVDGDAHTNGIESFWSMLKRAHHGIYHKMSPKHLDRYVQEFAGRHNLRDEDTFTQMGMVIRGLKGKRLTYAKLKETNGLSSARGQCRVQKG